MRIPSSQLMSPTQTHGDVKTANGIELLRSRPLGVRVHTSHWLTLAATSVPFGHPVLPSFTELAPHDDENNCQLSTAPARRGNGTMTAAAALAPPDRRRASGIKVEAVRNKEEVVMLLLTAWANFYVIVGYSAWSRGTWWVGLRMPGCMATRTCEQL